MRLDDIDRSSNVEDDRGGGRGGFGGGMMGGGGGLGIGAIAVLTLAGWLLGINPAILIGGAEMVSGGRSVQQSAQPSRPRQGSPEEEQMKVFVEKVLRTTELVWNQQLPAQRNLRYPEPRLKLFTGGTDSACGPARSEMGPFYCPADQRVYLDMSFFAEMQHKFGGGGDFAYAYVIAHEVGHHLENVLGILPKVQQMQQRLSRREANGLSVRVELMADCLAGVWAFHADRNYRILEPGDIEEAMRAASAIGDDRLTRGRAPADSFTHGTSEQRVRWLTQGLRSGRIDSCDTFNTRQL